ncbi:Cytochrome c domain-containing protein [Flavobacterium branchiophilum]|nr:putative lipoprotein [Flavobacterium branchiophilum]CCB69016.1 Probable lipoprotein precursor [Flavobacterium branchiophilum FL-15]
MKSKFLILCLVAMTFSCSKDETPVPVPVAPVAVTAFTNTTIKPILDKCVACHGAGGVAVNKWYYNPANYETSIKANIGKIYAQTSVFGAGMATANYGNLTQAQVNAIITWYQAGYPAN